MIYSSLDAFLKEGRGALAKGPIALIFLEDELETASSLRHLEARGFAQIIAFSPPRLALPAPFDETVHQVHVDLIAPNLVPDTVNRIIEAAPGIWMHYGFNAEYLYYPFAESRTIGEALSFVTEERRDTVLTFVIDAYARDLDRAPNAVDLSDAMIDKAGYYALRRENAQGDVMDRQLDFYGGLRWRFEEHVPKARRRIDRVALFRARPGLRLLPDFSFNIDEYNTYEAPWHNSLTAATLSFRMAKALKRNPGSSFDVHSFVWPNSVAIEWHSQQLLDLGLMEPGQWF